MEDLEKLAEVIPELETEKAQVPDEAQEDHDLEPETDEVSEAGVEAEEDEEELDLSDLEEPSAEEAEEDVGDLDLDLDMDLEPEAEEGAEELDLSDLEESSTEEAEEDEEELDLSDLEEPSTEEAEEDDQDAETVEFDMGTIADEVEAEKAIESIEEIEDEDIADEKTKPVKKSARKKPLSMPVRILLIIVLLGGGAYAAKVLLGSMNIPIKIPYVSELLSNIDIKIPYVSDLFKSKVQDVGNLKINTFDIKSKFIDNSKTGRLFVITGRAKNEYSKSRGLIKISGSLFTKGKKLTKTKTVYCGNFLSDLDLSTNDFDTINKRLAKRFGDKRSNAKIKPGGTIPFMIVFSNLPNNLEEFTINVVESILVK